MGRSSLRVAMLLAIAGCGAVTRVSREGDRALARGDAESAVVVYRGTQNEQPQSRRRLRKTMDQVLVAEALWYRSEIAFARAEVAAGRPQAGYEHLRSVVAAISSVYHPEVRSEAVAALREAEAAVARTPEALEAAAKIRREQEEYEAASRAAVAAVPPKPEPPTLAALEHRRAEAERLCAPFATEAARAVMTETREDVTAFWRSELALAGPSPDAQYFASCALRRQGVQAADLGMAIDQLSQPRWVVEIEGGGSCGPAVEGLRSLYRFGDTGLEARLKVKLASCEAVLERVERVEAYPYTVTIGEDRWIQGTRKGNCVTRSRYENDSGVSSGTGIATTTRIDYEVCEDVPYTEQVEWQRVEERVEELPTTYHTYRMRVTGTARAEWIGGAAQFDFSGDASETHASWSGEHTTQRAPPAPWSALASQAFAGIRPDPARIAADHHAFLRARQLERLPKATDPREQDAAHAFLHRLDGGTEAATWFAGRYGMPRAEAATILACDSPRAPLPPLPSRPEPPRPAVGSAEPLAPSSDGLDPKVVSALAALAVEPEAAGPRSPRDHRIGRESALAARYDLAYAFGSATFDPSAQSSGLRLAVPASEALRLAVELESPALGGEMRGIAAGAVLLREHEKEGFSELSVLVRDEGLRDADARWTGLQAGWRWHWGLTELATVDLGPNLRLGVGRAGEAPIPPAWPSLTGGLTVYPSRHAWVSADATIWRAAASWQLEAGVRLGNGLRRGR